MKVRVTIGRLSTEVDTDGSFSVGEIVGTALNLAAVTIESVYVDFNDRSVVVFFGYGQGTQTKASGQATIEVVADAN